MSAPTASTGTSAAPAVTRPRSSGKGSRAISRTLTYRDLHRDVCQFANVLKSLGVRKGDRVAIYMPLVPELAIAMLACARMGAVHSVVFGGFSAESLRDRINDAQAQAARDRRWRLSPRPDRPAQADCRRGPSARPRSSTVVVVQRGAGGHRPRLYPDVMKEGRDHWYHELMRTRLSSVPPEPMDSEDMLYILYTSGTTGKPKGIVHTTGGYLVGTYATTKMVFDLREEDVYWCTADIGWVTGHSYVVYGPLSNGATVLMYEGAPDWPQKDRFWALIERHGVTILYTAPTAIRAFMKWGTDWPAAHDLSRLRLLGSVGEPINPEAWIWYHERSAAGRCPIVDTWWQTETGVDHDLAAARRDDDQTRIGDRAAARHRGRDSRRERRAESRSAAACSRSPGPGLRCCAAIYGRSGALRAHSTGTSGARASTSPATARSATQTAISGSWAASTTC